jgi:hypothetical protein
MTTTKETTVKNLTEADAGRLIEWLEEGDAVISSNGLRLILPNGWQVEIEPDGDVDEDGRPVDCSTVAVSLYGLQLADPEGWGPDVYAATAVALRGWYPDDADRYDDEERGDWWKT